MSIMLNRHTMKQSPTPARLPPPSHSSCCCGGDDCHARARWQEDMDELKDDARAVADIAQKLVKENEQHVNNIEKLNAKLDAYKAHSHELLLSLEVAATTRQHLDQQLSEKCKQLKQVEARLEHINTKYKSLKRGSKTKSAEVKDMQLFVQNTVCEAVTREASLRGKLQTAESKLMVAERKLTAGDRIIAKDKQSHHKQGVPLLMDCKPIRLSAHTKLPQPIQSQQPVSNAQQQPSLSKTTSWATTLTAGSLNNDNKAYATKPTTTTTSQHDQPANQSKSNNDSHPAPSSNSMMKRSRPFNLKNIQPVNLWTIQVTRALEKLRATDLNIIEKRVRPPYDRKKMSEVSNSIIQDILSDIERLHTTEDSPLWNLCKILLHEIGELRTSLNDCL